MKMINVFCGSSDLVDKSFFIKGEKLGQLFSKNNIGLVYGGGSTGIMGAIANGVLNNNGYVYGVIPKKIVDLEVAHNGCSKLDIVDSMHERKEMMYNKSDAFIILPGGLGTLDEFCEITTWAQLDYHKKPIYLINQDGFYDMLIKHFKHLVNHKFLSQKHFDMIKIFNTSEDALNDFLS